MRLPSVLRVFIMLTPLTASLPIMASERVTPPVPESVKNEIIELSSTCCSSADAFDLYLQQVIALPWIVLPHETVKRVYGADNRYSHYILSRFSSDTYTTPVEATALSGDATPDQQAAQIELLQLALSALDSARVDLDDEVTALNQQLSLLSAGETDLALSARIKIFQDRLPRLDDEEKIEVLYRMFSEDEIPEVSAWVPSIIPLQIHGGAL